MYGQDVGRHLGGVFRETATLANYFGDHRVFNTAIQEAYIIECTAGLSATDMKGIMKAAFLDPNPVIMLEHKGLYWSKMPGTRDAKTAEPSKDYIIPLGKGTIVLKASETKRQAGDTCCIITYRMGVYWAKAAASQFPGQVEIVGLRSLFPIDDDLVFTTVQQHGKCIVLTEDTQNNSFAEALSGRISWQCFQWLDMAVEVIGSLNLPAVPLNRVLEQAMMPNPAKVATIIRRMLQY